MDGSESALRKLIPAARWAERVLRGHGTKEVADDLAAHITAAEAELAEESEITLEMIDGEMRVCWPSHRALPEGRYMARPLPAPPPRLKWWRLKDGSLICPECHAVRTHPHSCKPHSPNCTANMSNECVDLPPGVEVSEP